ncbi:Bud site selection protein, Revert to axial protein 1, partial [Lunasporangiospora selenospora]
MSSSNNNTSVPSTQPHPALDNQIFTDTEIMPEPTPLHPQQQQSTTGMPAVVPYATEPASISKIAIPSDPIPFTPSTLVESTPLPGEMRIAQTALEPAVLTPAPGMAPKAGQEGGVPLSQRKPSTQMNMTLTPAAAATATTATTRLTGSRLSGVSVQDEDPEAIFRLDQLYHAVPAPSKTSPGLSKGKGSIGSNKQRQLNKQQQQQQQLQPQPQPQQDQQASQAMDLTYSSSSENPRYQHLPTLWQILNRKTLPPVCLFNFYLYMRDCEQSAEEVDFWLDVTAHELLWKLYVRATRRRAALLAAERAERAEKEEEAAAARLEAEKWKSQ